MTSFYSPIPLSWMKRLTEVHPPAWAFNASSKAIAMDCSRVFKIFKKRFSNFQNFDWLRVVTAETAESWWRSRVLLKVWHRLNHHWRKHAFHQPHLPLKMRLPAPNLLSRKKNRKRNRRRVQKSTGTPKFLAVYLIRLICNVWSITRACCVFVFQLTLLARTQCMMASL